jgi:hypothetical protein
MKTYIIFGGALCLVTAVWLLIRRLRVLIVGCLTEGHVVSHETRESEDSLFFLPVVSFIDTQGREHRFTSVAGRSMRSPNIGDRVPVRYLESTPKLAYIGTLLHMWAAPVGFAVLGAAGLAVFWSR